MENIFIIAMVYMFAMFYRDAARDIRICSNLKMCNLELENTKLYLEIHNIRLD